MRFIDKWIFNYTEKRLKEIDEHPETNKNIKNISDKDLKFYITIVFILILTILFAFGIRFHTISAPM